MQEVRGGNERLVVLESFPAPHETTNPYVTMLFESLEKDAEPVYFSWRRALIGPFDVFHLHWPEVKVRGRTRIRGLIRCGLFVLLLVRIRVKHKALVRTLHNTEPHETPTKLQRAVIELSARWTTLWIRLSDRTVPPTAAPSVVAPLGHFRGWFGDAGESPPVPGRLLHFGHVRGYKGLDALVSAFSELPDRSLSLHIIGKSADPDLAVRLQQAATADRRIRVVNDYVPDEILRRAILESELVVLPFARITNSSSMLLALSLDRPVLVPAGGVTDGIAAEVGPGWVLTYDGSLDAATLRKAVEAVRNEKRPARPDLSQRSWDRIGALHAEAFAQAHDLARRRR